MTASKYEAALAVLVAKEAQNPALVDLLHQMFRVAIEQASDIALLDGTASNASLAAIDASLDVLAGAVTAARVAVDLAATPTANLATLAGAVSSAKVQSVVTAIDAPADVSHGQYTVTTSAVQINGATSVPTKGLVTIKARAANTDILYIGKSGVTTSTGFPLSASDTVLWPAANLNQIYAICAAGSPVLAWVVGV